MSDETTSAEEPRRCSFFATAAKGTEPALRDELRLHRFRNVRADRGGVHFEGPFHEGMRACLELRCAMRVLLMMGSFEAPHERALYDGIRALDFTERLSPKTTLAVRASTRSSALTHSQFVAQKTKDAIVDQLRDHYGERPDVDLDDPDVVVSVHLARDVVTVYLDLAGRPLFLRGYRVAHHVAPLKETLAASMIVLSGWAKRPDDFTDPMCGSGTLAIEAALFARRVAPGLVTKRTFGFERWNGFGEAERHDLLELSAIAEERARAAESHPQPTIVGRDLDDAALAIARDNAERAGVAIRFERGDVGAFTAAAPHTVLTNPPYGARVAMAPETKRAMGQAFARLDGCRLGVLSGDPQLFKSIPLRPTKVIQMMNGDIECDFALYDRRPREAP